MSTFSPQNIKIADFEYPLPDERIARHPLAERDKCRLLVVNPDGSLEDKIFSDLPDLLLTTQRPGMMVFNNTKVIHARIPFRRPTGAAIEVFLLEPLQPEDYVLVFQTRNACEWSCMVGNLKKWKDEFLERELTTPEGLKTRLRAYLGGEWGGNARRVRFEWDNPEVTFASVVECAGNIPIPPYLKRESEKSDETDYQTVYSKVKGSVAAPTAGLHFTPDILQELGNRGLELAEVTLHVGAGTFQPVKSAEIGGHPMHTEAFSVDADFLRKLALQVEEQNRGEREFLTAVGTTSVRTLETLPYLGRIVSRNPEIEERDLHLSQWTAYEEPISPEETPAYLQALADYAERRGGHIQASTAIMIAPGFQWNVVGRMVTNFHQPGSTLLLLVSSFMEPDRRPEEGGEEPRWRRVYSHALEGDYRFLSYGDACLLHRPINQTSAK